MPNQYGGIYRHPPAPQRSRPSAILPPEVFPDPPVGSRRRQIVMALVAAQWIGIPSPLQRPPVVIEEAVVEVFVPVSRVQDQLVIGSWKIPQQVQRPQPSAILPTQVFPNPPFGDQKAQIDNALVAAEWIRVPSPLQRRSVFTESGVPIVEVFVPYSREGIIVGLWIPEHIIQHKFGKLPALLPPPIFQITGGFLGRSFMS